MASFLAEKAEADRQEQADDKKFYRNMKYIFELRSKGSSFVYPLYLNPQDYTFDEPFTFNETPALYGGLIVEENGIIRRPVTLSGVVGLQPAFYQGPILSPTNADPTFKARGANMALSVSGPRHLQFLQDRVFRTYADLKRNLDTAESTSMRFHCLKDDEHWLVYPVSFELRRNFRRPSMYEYRIQLVGVSLATYKDPVLKAPDKSTFDDIKDGINTVRDGYDTLVGAVKDVQRTIQDVARFVNGVGQMIGDVTSFIDDIGNMLDSGSQLISAPFNTVTSLVTRIEDSTERLIDSGINSLDHIVASYDRMRDAVATFAIHPRYFDNKVRGSLTTRTPINQFGLAALQTASQNTSQQTADQFGRSGVLSGDLDRSRATGRTPIGSATSSAGFAGNAKPIFAQEYTISGGDTLPNIANRLLGDAKRWLEIASLNKLQAPYISDLGLPGTLSTGAKILVPSTTSGTAQAVDNLVFGALPSDELEIQLYGRDIGLYKNEFNLYDMELTSDLTDTKSVSGIKCLSQGLTMRVEIDRGSDQLYPNLGFLNVAGLRDAALATDMVETRFSEAVLADPRVRAVPRVRVDIPQPDQRSVDADITVIGSSTLVPIAAITSVA